MRILKCDPQTEIIGQALLGLIQNFEADNYQTLLKKYHLLEIAPDKWYPAQNLLDLMNEMAQHHNLSSNLVAIGMSVAQHAVLPPGAEKAGLAQILEMYSQIYGMQHRNGDLGYTRTEKITDTHYKVYRKTIYPDDLGYGTLYGLARRFLPKGTRFSVKYDEAVTRLDEGGEVTVIHVSW